MAQSLAYLIVVIVVAVFSLANAENSKTKSGSHQGGQVEYTMHPSLSLLSFSSIIQFSSDTPANVLCGISYQTPLDFITLQALSVTLDNGTIRQFINAIRDTDLPDSKIENELYSMRMYEDAVGIPIQMSINIIAIGNNYTAILSVNEDSTYYNVAEFTLRQPPKGFTVAAVLANIKTETDIFSGTITCSATTPQIEVDTNPGNPYQMSLARFTPIPGLDHQTTSASVNSSGYILVTGLTPDRATPVGTDLTVPDSTKH